MKRNLPGDQTLTKASQGESTKKPRGRLSKNDLLKGRRTAGPKDWHTYDFWLFKEKKTHWTLYRVQILAKLLNLQSL